MLVAIDAVGIRMGGGATLLAEFLRSLPEVRPEWEWLVFLLPRNCREFDEPPARDGVRIETISAGNSAVGRLWWLYRELPRRLDAARASALLAFANVASPRSSVPQVGYVHQLLAFKTDLTRPASFRTMLRRRGLRHLIVRGARASSFVVVQTGDMRRRLETAAPELRDRIRTIPGCVPEVELHARIREEKQALIDGASWPRLLYVAHPAEHKNHPRLIQAMPEIVRRHPSATLLVTLEPDGPDAIADQGYLQGVRRAASENGVDDHIVWLGTLSQAEVRYALRQCTLALFPSLDESFGLPLAEAISEMCPLAASSLPFARDVAGKAAVYFDPLDADSISRCVANLLETPEQLNLLKQEARVRRVRFQSHNVADQIATVLQAAVDQEKNSHAQVG